MIVKFKPDEKFQQPMAFRKLLFQFLLLSIKSGRFLDKKKAKISPCPKRIQKNILLM